jgi:hypothetical protein
VTMGCVSALLAPLADAGEPRSVWPLQFTRVAPSPTPRHLDARV